MARRPLPPLLRPLASPLRAFGLLLLLFTAGRAGFLLIHGDTFAHLGAGAVAQTFLLGLRFDTAAILRWAGLPLLLLTVPVPARIETAWRRTWGWTAYAIAALLALDLAADLGYFPYLHRHMGLEFMLLREDADGIAKLLATEFRWGVAGLLALWTTLFVVWRRWVLVPATRADEDRPTRPTAWSAAAIALVLSVAGARGTAWGGPLRDSSAYHGRSGDEVHLALNAPFVLWGLLGASGPAAPSASALLPADEAVEVARGTAFRADERPAGDRFPFARRGAVRAADGAARNVLVLVLEGWSADALDSLRSARGLAPLGMSPSFDRAAARGRLFTRCYAAGQRTNEGYTAVLTGLAPAPGAPLLTDARAAPFVPTLPQIAGTHGYERVLVQGSRRGTQLIEEVSARVGFDRVLAAEDLGARGATGRADDAPPLDGPLCDRILGILQETERPTLVVAKTQDTHAPYPPAPATEASPAASRGSTPRDEFLRVLRASDDAVGRLLDRLAASPKGAQTVVVVVSDHIQRIDASDRVLPPDLFWIPLLVLAPGIAPGTDDRIASQCDVLPTILDLLGWDDLHASAGSSLVSPGRPASAGAMCGFGGTIVRIEAGGWVAHDLASRVDAAVSAPGGDLGAIERRLLAVEQVTGAALREDCIAPH